MRRARFAVAAVLAGAAPASAEPDDFYRGKQLTLVVNYTTGGPTDTEARLLARHLSKHIPGNPPIVVRNMGGAGGMIGLNWLGQVAAPDGLTFGYMTGLAGAAAHDLPTLKVDATKLPFVAGVEGLTVAYARSDLGHGLEHPADLMAQSGFWLGGLTPDTDKDLRLRLELDLLGLKYRYISGYPGAAEARMALEQNEVQLTAESLPTYRVSIEPSLVQTHKAIPLWYDVPKALSDAPHPDAGGIEALPFEAFYRQVKGAPPDDELWETSEFLKEVGTSFLRTINLPPSAPPEALRLLRAGIAAMVQDADYREDALRTIKFAPRFTQGPKVEATLAALLHPDPRLKAFVAAYTEKGQALVGK